MSITATELIRDEMKFQTRRARKLRKSQEYPRLWEVNQARRGLAVIHRLIREQLDYQAIETAIQSIVDMPH